MALECVLARSTYEDNDMCERETITLRLAVIAELMHKIVGSS